MDHPGTTPPMGSLPGADDTRTVRVVTIEDGQSTAQNVRLTRAEAAHRFGADAAATIFTPHQPGADLNYATAVTRYGAQAAALIFPEAARTANNRDAPTLAAAAFPTNSGSRPVPGPLPESPTVAPAHVRGARGR